MRISDWSSDVCSSDLEADLQRIFEPFERVGNTGAAPGIGLGLTITRLLTEIMGAELSVDSRPGAGSSFKVRMFFSDAPPSGTAAPAGARIAGYAGPRRRILVTDDDPARSEEQTSELQSLMRNSYAVFCLKKKIKKNKEKENITTE